MFVEAVYSATLVTLEQVLYKNLPGDHMAVRVEYTDKESFKRLAKALGIMDDLKVFSILEMHKLIINGTRILSAIVPVGIL